ncbi:MAG: amino acid ABC transporter [Chloroflexi bacterium HGW-Chloroflexi-1]|nr:MAG: amino acid ABC transporter [Chloroflexi bacterium HGW-Chloroflexi-1]
MSVMEEVSLARPEIKSRKTFSQQMRDFPWWGVVLVLGITLAFVAMLQSEQYRAALQFIVNPDNTTEIAAGILIKTGVRVTLLVTVVSYVIALVLGLILGIMRVSGNPILFHLSTLYVEVMRGVPMLVLILWIGFVVVPGLRDATNGAFELSRVQGGIAGLALGYAAYLAEVYRAGIESIHKGQMEAARSLGMSYVQAMRHVILPQAIRRVVPPLANDFVAMLKDSALVSVVAVPEILQSARLYVSRTFRAFEGYNSAALLYLILTLLFVFLVRYIEGRWRVDA